MSKILITGVAGMIGGSMAEYLISKKHEVVGIDDLSGGMKCNIPKQVKFYKTNILNSKIINDIFKKEKFDYVYHFAAYAAECLSPFIRNFNYQNNLVGSANIINSSVNNNVKKIIFASSIAVYGHGNPPYKENHAPSPIDPYGIAKYATELDLKLAQEQFGLNYSIIRPHNVIAVSRQNYADLYRNVISIFIRQCINNQSISIFGDGSQTRAFSDIKYSLNPMLRLLKYNENKIFNLGSDKTFTIKEAADLVIKNGKKYGFHNTSIKHYEPRHEVKHAHASHELAKKELNFKDDTDLEKVIDDMWKYILNSPRRNPKRMRYEITKNIYSYWK